MQRIFFFGLVILILGVLGMGNKVKADDGITCKLEVSVLQSSCKFMLFVKNHANAQAMLQFPTSQYYDFVVKDSKGDIVWKWAQGMMFAQAFTSLTLGPNEEKIFSEEYSLPAGEYTAQGILTCQPEIYTEWISFTVSQDQKKALRGRITKILDKMYLLGDDGTAYLIESPSADLESLINKRIEVTSCQTEPIHGTIDKKIIIEEYRLEE